MITQIEVGNVRVFDGVGDWKFPLSKANVFCGTNGAGKSTLFKCLLLLMQTQAATEVESWTGRLRLGGPLVDLGTYSSFVSHNDISRDIVLGIKTVGATESRFLNRLRAAKRAPVLEGPEQRYTGYHLESSFRFGILGSGEPEQLSLEPMILEPQLSLSSNPLAYLKEATFNLVIKDEQGELTLPWKVLLTKHYVQKRAITEYSMFIPVDYFGANRGFTMMEVGKDESESNVVVATILRGLLPTGLWALPKKSGGKGNEEPQQWSYFPIPPLIRDVLADLARELTDVHYLGPLRSPAKRFYLTNLDAAPGMDAAGDFLPYVLRDQGSTNVSYVPPYLRFGSKDRPLKQALNEWLHYLRTGEFCNEQEVVYLDEIDFTSAKDVLLEFKLMSFGGETHALADSGFGYSQLLPIVVMGLIARVGSTLAIEQPELHLNPALQVRMAEFLASLAIAGKTVLIETHSEHIVNTLRVLAAEESTGDFANKCRIFYLDTEFGVPRVQMLDIEYDGTVPEWPRSFMGEALSLSSRLMRAQQSARKGKFAR